MNCEFNTHQQDVPEQDATTIARFVSRGLSCNQPNTGGRQKSHLYLNKADMICQFNTHQQDVPEQDATTIARLPCNQPNSGRGQKTDWYLKEADMICLFNTHNVPEQDAAAIARILSRGLRNQPNSGQGEKTRTKRPRLSEFYPHKINRFRRGPWGSRRPPDSLGGLETSARGKGEQSCFKKESPLWREVEALKELRKLPQNPTFRALETSRMCLREGEAIGLMVTFANMVEKTSTMWVDADRQDINDDLEVLEELENNGFDIRRLRVRLTQILDLKDRRETEDNIRRMNEIIEEKREAVNKASCSLKRFKVACTLYKNTQAYLETLETRNADRIKRNADRIKSVRMKFEALVASPLY